MMGCSNPWNTAFVWSGGHVTHCCYSNFGALGSIHHHSLDEIWRGPKISAIRASLQKNDYHQAGCENFCRLFRWQQLYGNQDHRPTIPSGLGRIDCPSTGEPTPTPEILGLSIDWRCDLHCRHCLAKRQGKGLTNQEIAKLDSWLAGAKVLRFIGGEPLANQAALNLIQRLTQQYQEPQVFLSSNGQTGIAQFGRYINHLHGFHLKFSLEGLDASYERIRTKASFELFVKNLESAHQEFRKKRDAGNDWRLYLNFCAMRSNLDQIPAVIRFAAQRELPLVINTINGMRHIEENLFMYRHLQPSPSEIAHIQEESMRALEKYPFAPDIRIHLEYLWKTLQLPRLSIPALLIPLIREPASTLLGEKALYTLYKLSVDRKAFWIYLVRKVGPGLWGWLRVKLFRATCLRLTGLVCACTSVVPFCKKK